MNKLFFLLAIVAAILFGYSAVNLSSQIGRKLSFSLGEIKGFEDVNRSSAYTELVEKFRQKISVVNSEAERDGKYYFWLAFAVTGLTAASTLVSSIQAAKKDDPAKDRSKSFAITVAVLAFLSTLINFGAGRFNELKTEATKKAADLSTMRNQFYSDYDKASPETKDAIIVNYSRRLD